MRRPRLTFLALICIAAPPLSACGGPSIRERDDALHRELNDFRTALPKMRAQTAKDDKALAREMEEHTLIPSERRMVEAFITDRREALNKMEACRSVDLHR